MTSAPIRLYAVIIITGAWLLAPTSARTGQQCLLTNAPREVGRDDLGRLFRGAMR